MNALEHFEEFEGLEEQDEQQQFEITDDNAAEWAVKKIAAREAERNRMVMACKNEIERYQAIMENERQRAEADTGFLRGKLYEYFLTVEKETTKTQAKYRLPSADLVMKFPQPEIVHDDAVVIEYCKAAQAAEFVKTTETLAWGEFKKRLETSVAGAVDSETGEIVPGITITPREPAFEIKIK